MHSLTCEGTYLTMSIANFTPIAIRSKHAQHFHSGYVQIPMAVKEAACAKLSIPWRPNLGIQRVSNAKGSLAYKCFWHPQAPAIGIAEGI